jgi:hypothetical protein
MDVNDLEWIRQHVPHAHQSALAWHADMACALDSERFAKERLRLDDSLSRVFCLGVSIVEGHRRTELREHLVSAFDHAATALSASSPGTDAASRVGTKLAMLDRLLVEVSP